MSKSQLKIVYVNHYVNCSTGDYRDIQGFIMIHANPEELIGKIDYLAAQVKGTKWRIAGKLRGRNQAVILPVAWLRNRAVYQLQDLKDLVKMEEENCDFLINKLNMFITAKQREADWIIKYKLEVSNFPLRLKFLNSSVAEDEFLYNQDLASYPQTKLNYILGLIKNLDDFSFKTFYQVLKLALDRCSNGLQKLGEVIEVNESRTKCGIGFDEHTCKIRNPKDPIKFISFGTYQMESKF